MRVKKIRNKESYKRPTKLDDPEFLQIRNYVRRSISIFISNSYGYSRGDSIELAKIMQRSPALISKWLNGKHNFTIDTISEISFRTKIPVKNLFGFYQAEEQSATLKAMDNEIIEMLIEHGQHWWKLK